MIKFLKSRSIVEEPVPAADEEQEAQLEKSGSKVSQEESNYEVNVSSDEDAKIEQEAAEE